MRRWCRCTLLRLKERVNAVYGYAAITRIHLTQTAATGFAEGQAEFTPAPKAAKAATRRRHQAEAAAHRRTDPKRRLAHGA